MNTRKLKIRIIIIIIIFLAIFNIFNAFFHQLPEETSTAVNSTRTSLLTIKPLTKVNVTYYRSAGDTSYHYEFRYELNTNSTNDNQRLMILINGDGYTCADYWNSPADHHILSTLNKFHFSILAICSKRKTFDTDVKWIYFSLQQWMNEIYYNQFRQYPRLYIYGISHGSKLATLLSRVLPIQAQILTIYPGDSQGMLTRSDHHIDMQTRLQLDPIFANWFYFNFCYYKKFGKMKTDDICPFQYKRNNHQPVAPTYFIHLQEDPIFTESNYTSMINNTFQLGEILLNDTQSLKLHIVQPLNATSSTYRQKTMDMWYSKPYASQFFSQHLIAPELHRPYNKTRKTCWCLSIDFRYYELYPNITNTWSKQKQEEYSDYARDIKVFKNVFCEDICDDLLAHHAISSRDFDKSLDWIHAIDDLRHSFHIKDYLTRPLRIWVYEKDLIDSKMNNFSSQQPNWVKVLKPYQMYSPEYYLQDYFQHMKISNTHSHHNLIWANNPLLADYFIIPSDLMFYYSYAEPSNMTNMQFENLRRTLNHVYFDPLLERVQILFPYWTMAKQEDQMGSNHIIIMVGGRNMGFIYKKTQNILKNVIQLAFTGIRQDLLPSNAQPLYTYRSMTILYRHGYDVVIPQFTRLKLNESTLLHLNRTLKNKQRLFFFAGALSHSMNSHSARPLLSYLWKNIKEKQLYNMTIDIQGKRYDTIKIIEGHIKPDEYIKSIQSSIFSLCPEGFLPWSPRLYETIKIGAIPVVLADNIVLPFERFIDWQSFSVKINVSNIKNLINYVYRIDNFEKYIQQKLQNAIPYFNAFQWPYSMVDKKEHVFVPHEDENGTASNVFHYISLELQCRRLEQFYGLTSESFSRKSIEAQQQACKNYPSICPCHNAQRSVALKEYM